ncbi:MAG: hypothetical protein OES47_07060 [Acidobacteriota bacterium]|nr:hypothetical protein [Acidobacteriota bacterium]
MPECVDSQKLIERLLETNEIGDLEGHVAGCPVCSELYEVHRQLAGVDLKSVEPADADLLELRRGVLRKVRNEPARERGWGPISAFFARPAFAAALAAVLLVVGFFVGVGGPRGMQSPSAPKETLTEGIELAASQSHRLAESENSPYLYSNVQVKELDSDTIALSFDVSTHLDLIRQKDDPLVTEVLVQSLVNRSPLDTRLEAISLAPSLEPKVQDALIAALLEDDNLAVRLKALDRLAADPSEPQVRAAFLDVLKREESVQLRLLAIDNLTAGQVPPEALTAALAEGRPEPGTAIAARARTYLADF